MSGDRDEERGVSRAPSAGPPATIVAGGTLTVALLALQLVIGYVVADLIFTVGLMGVAFLAGRMTARKR